MFLTLTGGLEGLTEALEESLSEEKIITGQAVTGLSQQEAGYELNLSGGERLNADGVILAVPAFAAARLLDGVPEAAYLERIRYVSVANLAFAYRREDVPHDLNGSGVLIPRGEGRMITAITWVSSKWLHSAPGDKALLRAYIGRLGDEAWTAMCRADIERRVAAEPARFAGHRRQPAVLRGSPLCRSRCPNIRSGMSSGLRRCAGHCAGRSRGCCCAARDMPA